MLAFIETLDHKEMVGVNPEYAHETMAGLNFTHHVAQAIESGKLFHIDLNGQKMGRFDQDLRFGSEDIKGSFMVVRLLEMTEYSGPRHFDAHAYRTEDCRRRLGFRARLHAHLRDPQRESRSSSTPTRKCARSCARSTAKTIGAVEADSAAIQQRQRREAQSREARSRGAREEAAAVRAAGSDSWPMCCWVYDDVAHNG
jgi:xylose isomerase